MPGNTINSTNTLRPRDDTQNDGVRNNDRGNENRPPNMQGANQQPGRPRANRRERPVFNRELREQLNPRENRRANENRPANHRERPIFNRELREQLNPPRNPVPREQVVPLRQDAVEDEVLPPPPGPPPNTTPFTIDRSGATFDSYAEWTVCKPNGLDTSKRVDQGWKLHIPASRENAQDILDIIMPILVRLKVDFKFATSEAAMRTVYNTPGQNGKFIAVYPTDINQAFDVAYAVNRALRKAEIDPRSLPAVAGDRPVGRYVFARLGRFTTGDQIFDKEGNLQNDDRSKSRPDGEADPWVNYSSRKRRNVDLTQRGETYGFKQYSDAEYRRAE